MTGKILTGNRVDDGEVVFLTPAGEWAPGIQGARLAQDDAAVSALEQEAGRAAAGTEVTDIYLFDAQLVDGAIRPAHIRERIRTLGPTVRGDLGKQADGTGGAFQAAE